LSEPVLLRNLKLESGAIGGEETNSQRAESVNDRNGQNCHIEREA